MNAPKNIQIINGPDGKPEYVVIPYAQYLAERRAEKLRDPNMIPNKVVGRTVDGATHVKAWREHLGFTQAEVAAKLGIMQGAYAQQEGSDKLRRSTREKIAAALGIFPLMEWRGRSSVVAAGQNTRQTGGHYNSWGTDSLLDVCKEFRKWTSSPSQYSHPLSSWQSSC